MKTKITIIFILGLIVFAFRFFDNQENQSATSTLPPADSSFIIGVLESGAEWRYDRLVDSLGSNLWHRYPSDTNGWITGHNNWQPFDFINADYEYYHDGVEDIIGMNQDSGMYTLMNRGKIQRLCFGQRSDYQCENVSMVETDYWFYTFRNRENSTSDSNKTGTDTVDNSLFGNGAKVVKCKQGIDQPGYVVKGLKANREQINCLGEWGFKAIDSRYIWYVKPRIRIDTSFASNPLNLNTVIARVDVLSFDGTIIKRVNLRSRNFKFDDTYNGRYIEEFNYINNDTQLVLNPLNDDLFNPNCEDLYDTACAVDFRVYWYGLCDMWIDYVRVENDIAYDLFRGVYTDPSFNREWLKWEAQDIASQFPNGVYRFYIEEFEFNQIPVMSYVNQKIDSLSLGKFSLMCNLNYSTFKIHAPGFQSFSPSAEYIDRTLIDKIGSREIFMGAYGFLKDNEYGLNSYVPNTLDSSGFSIPTRLGAPVNVQTYENWLQSHLDADRNQWFDFTNYYKLAQNISKISNIPFINLIQTHGWYSPTHELREPTNQEISLLSYLGLSYGTKGIIYFQMNGSNIGFVFPGTSDTSKTYSRGLGDLNPQTMTYLEPRYINAYGQEKWKSVCELNHKIKKISSSLINFDNDYTESYIYRLADERNEMSANTFIDKLKAFPAFEFAPDPDPDLSNLTAETNTDAYLQAAFFQKENDTMDMSKYFMIINRRCSPFIDYTSADKIGGRRLVTMKINPAHLQNFNNWKIFDLETEDSIRTISKNDTNYLFLGDFMPGEGRLYKIAPVMQEGGTLVANEVLNGVTFDCNGNVNNNGKDITIYVETNVNFSKGVKWNITGGEFKCGLFPDNPDASKVNMNAQTGLDWKGIKFEDCSNVYIYNTVFSNIKGDTSALQLINCNEFNITSNKFNLTNSDSVKSISADYVGSGEYPIEPIINYNEFNVGSSKVPTVECRAYGALAIPLMLNGNKFNSTAGNIAIFLLNISAGVIKNDSIKNYKTGINILSSASYADLYNNKINCDSIGVQICNGTINLGFQSPNYTGGFNVISASNNGGNDIKAVAGYFMISEGFNTFNINNSNTYHLEGIFPSSWSIEALAIENCFKLNNSVSDPRENVGCTGLGCDVLFEFEPRICAITQTDEYFVVDLGNQVYDTIFIEGGGMGGGASNEKLKIENEKLESAGSREIYNLICLEMRKRNYELVHTKCTELLNNYIDSIESMDALSKLYHSSLILDEGTGNKMTSLKTYYESLILENGSNEELVKKLYYLIQKCKVSLGQYESAMDGFQQIINQNPYSYEGLVASWDYAATNILLNGQGGSGGGISNDELGITNYELGIKNYGLVTKHENNLPSQIQNPKFQILNDDPNEKYDKKVFTKEDRKVIKGNIFKSLESARAKEFERIKELQRKIENGEANKNEEAEYESKKILGEVIKVRKPDNISQHINFVNENINKLFSSSSNSESFTGNNNLIPLEYNLNQNYPNPFNPTTKISFDLPEDGTVKLFIYDVLGREILKLVNNELRTAGRYTVEFNGVNLASGVYFYRLEVNKFVQTKRMVLIK